MDTQDLLSDFWTVCAVLQTFDAALLQALGVQPPGVLSDLVAAGQLVASDLSDRYTLCPAVRAAYLPSDPNLLITLHTRAFDAYCRRLEQVPTRADEVDLYHHLAALFRQYFMHDDWATIIVLVRVTAALPNLNPTYLLRLQLYEALRALRAGDYAPAGAVLEGLGSNPQADVYTRLRALNGMALLHMEYTRYESALAYYRAVYDLALRTDDTLYQGIALTNMSMVYNDLGYWEEALEQLEPALVLFRSTGDAEQEVVALHAIANNATQLGRWQMAHDHLEAATLLATTLNLTARLDYIHWSRGWLAHLIGDASAAAAYDAALVVASERTALDIRWFRAFLDFTEGRLTEAEAGYRAALDIAEQRQRHHYVVQMQYHLGRLYDAAGDPERALAAYAQAIDGLEDQRIAADDEKIKLGLVHSTQTLYEVMVQACLAAGDLERAFEYMERARAQALLDRLAQRDITGSLARDPVVDVKGLQAALAPDEVALVYYTSGVITPTDHLVRNLPPASAALRTHLRAPLATYLVAVTPTTVALHPLVLASKEMDLLYAPPGEADPVRRLVRPHLLQTLYKRLVAPAAEVIEAAGTVYLVPHGPLHYVPWMALTGPDGAYWLAADGPALAVAPSATLLVRHALARSRPPTDRYLTIGYNDPQHQLKYAEAEAQIVAHLMGGTAWTDATPKRDRLAGTPPVDWLHVSAHAEFLPRDPLASFVRLGQDDAWRAHEVLAHGVPAARLSLSACASALAGLAPGDDLMGLVRGFLHAGVVTIVCAPWQTGDVVSLLVMTDFYARVRTGAGPAAALRDALVTVRAFSVRDVRARLAYWITQYPDLREVLTPLTLVDADNATQPYANPEHWAPFMVIGRAT